MDKVCLRIYRHVFRGNFHGKRHLTHYGILSHFATKSVICRFYAMYLELTLVSEPKLRVCGACELSFLVVMHICSQVYAGTS